APVKEVPPAAHEYRSGLTLLHPHSAGIDVHSDMHMVCVPVESVSGGVANAGGGLPPNVRRFGANSCDLKAIAEWLQACGVTTVAMESTGVYWIPLFELRSRPASRCAWSNRGNCHDATRPLFRALGVDLTEVEGIDVGTALFILAEIGVDVSRFPTEKHFASWLGVCPRQYESNRTKKKRGPRKGKNRVAIAPRMAAQAVGRTQLPLGLFYRRIKSRIGGQAAVTATAHTLARLVYRILRYGTEYVKLGMEDYQRKIQAQVERSLRPKAAALGYQLVPRSPATPEPVEPVPI